MKKIFLIILSIMLLSGCSDYKEVNEMAIISAIGIDYYDDDFIVTLETFNNKMDKQSGVVKTYTRTSKGKNIAVALEEAADLLSSRAYYSHVKLLVVSEEVAEHYLKDLMDFFMRSTYLRENFNIVVSKVKPEIVLSMESDENPIASIALNLLLQTNKFASNYAIDKTFDELLGEIITFGEDGALSVINVEDNNFYIDGMAIFKDYHMIDILDNKEAVIYNLLKKEIRKPVFSLDYEGKSFVISIYDIAPKIEVNEQEIKITGLFKAKIMENNPDFDIKDTQVLEKIDQDFSNYLNEQITSLIQKLQKENSDILALANNYYINSRIKNNKLWQHAKVNSDVSVVINKKGLIFNIYETN